eukprot:3283433-Alexandrium_andersonii.AAC.1
MPQGLPPAIAVASARPAVESADRANAPPLDQPEQDMQYDETATPTSFAKQRSAASASPPRAAPARGAAKG